MNLLENIRMAVSSIKTNKMRTLLTMLGIIIGISAVVAISAIGNGGKYQIQKSLEQFGTNRLMVFMNWSNDDPITHRDFINDRDIEAIRQIAGVEAVAPIYEERSTIKVEDKDQDVLLVGANTDTEIINNVEMLYGRYITNQDNESYANTIVLSDKDAKDIFGKTEVIGEAITLNTYRGPVDFRVVGVYKQEDSPFGSAISGGTAQVYVPINTILRVYNQTVYYGVNLKIQDRNEMDRIGERAISLLERLHNNKDKYRTFNLEQALEAANSVIGTITTVLAFIAGIALLVGGIGIMNIMLVTVTERIREIGVKKAIGAKRIEILFQFLTESAIISFTGGLLGIVFGFLLATAASSFLQLPPLISAREVLVSAVLSISIGILFGVYPANRAAKLDPIEALRYE
ncbi:FtsX-like permease family protein [Alkaliphilus pronyensis]|uniref:FtsX-like permease family protein n=1 Tax=Alkaliphilus pronyensis TaxID=1482732 RepID=A0A6I0F8N9_9FIRM|nr:ABC transporter permease [Alkaliphilus pronyensis]KAB3532426.1 FtsX-like permease family protein [Alkaliphilus pronyensis]